MVVWVRGAGLGVPSPDASDWLCGRLGMSRMLIVLRLDDDRRRRLMGDGVGVGCYINRVDNPDER